jgi:imidazoleglycerol phosphate synthase glutamine amidotransferase subunit HisH
MRKVTVVDHGLCNLFNLSCALEEVGVKVVVARDATQIAEAQSLILPGGRRVRTPPWTRCARWT